MTIPDKIKEVQSSRQWENFVKSAFAWNPEPKTVIFSCEQGFVDFVAVLNEISGAVHPLDVEVLRKKLVRHNDGSVSLNLSGTKIGLLRP